MGGKNSRGGVPTLASGHRRNRIRFAHEPGGWVSLPTALGLGFPTLADQPTSRRYLL